jgi:hypothetical protein
MVRACDIGSGQFFCVNQQQCLSSASFTRMAVMFKPSRNAEVQFSPRSTDRPLYVRVARSVFRIKVFNPLRAGSLIDCGDIIEE